MRYEVTTEQKPTATQLGGTILVLSDTKTGSRAEVWPALGFNCYRWRATPHSSPPFRGGSATELRATMWPASPRDNQVEVLYADPALFTDGTPTRSGIPILFPFPNRIRGGRYVWQDREYQMPMNDSTGKHAIHGFTCRKPWRVVDQGANDESAWVTGEFQGSVDAPEARSFWPADYGIRVTCRLLDQRLRIEAVVSNPDKVDLPFGLGYHPYFQVPLVPGQPAAECIVQASCDRYWEAIENLPTGTFLPVSGMRDLHNGKKYGELQLDDYFRSTPSPRTEGLHVMGSLTQGDLIVQLKADPAFGELVIFTPAHRRAIALEPYTCATDAINLQARGIDAGLQVLQPGAVWSGTVEIACHEAGSER